MNPALKLLSDAFGMTLNPSENYGDQLETLAANGSLSSKNATNKVLFGLCQIIDDQEKRLKQLTDDRVAIAKQMLDLEGKLPPPQPSPTEPLG